MSYETYDQRVGAVAEIDAAVFPQRPVGLSNAVYALYPVSATSRLPVDIGALIYEERHPNNTVSLAIYEARGGMMTAFVASQELPAFHMRAGDGQEIRAILAATRKGE